MGLKGGPKGNRPWCSIQDFHVEERQTTAGFNEQTKQNRDCLGLAWIKIGDWHFLSQFPCIRVMAPHTEVNVGNGKSESATNLQEGRKPPRSNKFVSLNSLLS